MNSLNHKPTYETIKFRINMLMIGGMIGAIFFGFASGQAKKNSEGMSGLWRFAGDATETILLICATISLLVMAAAAIVHLFAWRRHQQRQQSRRATVHALRRGGV